MATNAMNACEIIFPSVTLCACFWCELNLPARDEATTLVLVHRHMRSHQSLNCATLQVGKTMGEESESDDDTPPPPTAKQQMVTAGEEDESDDETPQAAPATGAAVPPQRKERGESW